MTVARSKKETLPPLAQRLCSKEGARRLVWFGLSVLIAPMLLAGLGALVFLDELKDAHQSGTEVWGLPVVAIGERGPMNIFGWEAAVGDEPRGWISIGRRPVGLVAIGFQPTGVIAIGNYSVGVVAIGHLAIGVLPIGFTVVGLASLGFASVGWLSFGMGCVGWHACGQCSLGAHAYGYRAYGVYRASSYVVQKPTRARLPPAPPLEKLLFARWRASQAGS